MMAGDMTTAPDGGSTPRPDPTLLTTEALNREVTQLESQINGRILQLHREIELLELSVERRLAAAHELTVMQFTTQETLRTSEITGVRVELRRVEELATEKHLRITDDMNRLEMLRDEKLKGVGTQFDLMEAFRVEQKHDCVEASTPVLCADLIWRPAGSLVVGDELITCDDEAITEPGKRSPRRYRRGVVTANSLEQDNLLRVSTPEGDVLCNAHHPFLTLRPQASGRMRYWHWITASDLRDGDLLMHAVDVWEVEQTWEAGWLAGMYDGEGCLGCYGPEHSLAKLTIVQRNSPTADLIGQSLKARVDTLQIEGRKRIDNRQPQTQFVITRRPDVMKILGSVRPPRLLVRADQVWENQTIGAKFRSTPLISVEPAGRGTIAMLSTSTGTYIANGFIVHNTQAAVDAALAAAKEAVQQQTIASDRSITKSETATSEQLKQMNVTTSTAIQGINLIIDDVKERISRMETLRVGVNELRVDSRDNRADIRGNISMYISMLAVFVSIGILVIAVVTHH